MGSNTLTRKQSGVRTTAKRDEASEQPDGYTIVVISPCRNEELTLERTLAAVRAQTRPPDLWVIVDDGSTDRTSEILATAEAETPWIRVVRRMDRGFRRVGAGVVDAFYSGLETVDIEHDFIAKLDMDLEFQPTYFEHILRYFEADPKLGAASGKLFHEEGDRLVEQKIIDESVLGAFQFYRRETFERIGGFVRAVMWDGIAFHQARLAGYRTRSYEDDELRIVELRPMGSTEGNIYRGRIRWGRGQWFMGSAFAYVMVSGIFRMRERPYGISGLLIIAGYLWAALSREPRYEDPDFRRELHRWQYQRLSSLLRGKIPS